MNFCIHTTKRSYISTQVNEEDVQMTNYFESENTNYKVLISGAGIAGLATAYWLAKYGFIVTVVERADTIREGGYPVDIEGSAIEVTKRMGIETTLRTSHISTDKITFKTPEGQTEATLPLEWIQASGEDGESVELPRGTLANILFEETRKQNIHFLFANSIRTMKANSEDVDVTFQNGKEEVFHYVIGADGIHSNTRDLSLGREEEYIRYLGYNFYGSTIPNHLQLSKEALIQSAPGRSAIFYEIGDGFSVHVLLATKSEKALSAEKGTRSLYQEQFLEKFPEKDWKIPNLKEDLQESTEGYYDMVAQVHLPVWSKNRIAFVGDAAFAPSFLSGQGTSLALIGAYVLAGELATKNDFTAAFSEYETKLRPFVEEKQKSAYESAAILIPATKEDIDKRNHLLTALQSASKQEISKGEPKNISYAFDLPEY